MHAPPPTRAILSTTIALGAIVIPVQIFSGQDEGGKIKRQEYTADGEKVGRVCAVKDANGDLVRLVDNSEIHKMFPSDEGLVELSDEEIAAVLQRGTGVSDTLCFLPNSYLRDGTYSIKNQYQVRPAKAQRGRNKVDDPKVNKVFALMAKALRDEDVFALVELTMSGTPQYAAITATDDDMTLYTLKYDEEIREPLPMPSFDFSEEEMTMAKTLIQFARRQDAPALENSSAEKIREYANVKAKTGQIVQVQDPASVAAGEAHDLLAQLTAAVEAAGGRK